MGFKINPLNKLITGIDNLLINYSKIEKARTKIDFDIDGIVYKINDFELQKRLEMLQIHQGGLLHINLPPIKPYPKYLILKFKLKDGSFNTSSKN